MSAPEPLHRRWTHGTLVVHELQAGGQRLDGGAMFGVVPKPLWERRLPADDRNRIQLGMRCLLVEHPDGLVLVDTGAGNKESARFYDVYGIENVPADPGEHLPTALESALAAAGFGPHQVTLVVNTHLHFDHAGGNTVRTSDGEIALAFPNATYVVQRGEYDFAHGANERTTASYFPRNYEPVKDVGRLELLSGEQELLSGIVALPTPGHTPHHQSLLVRSGDATLCFLGDVVPTRWHLPLPWIMGYDVEPLVTLETKRRLLAQAMDEGWLLMFEHDADTAVGRVAHDGKAYHLVEVDASERRV